MADAADVHGVVFKNSSAILLARVVGAQGAPLTQSDVASAKYTAYLLDENDPDQAAPITGHTGVAVDVASLVYNGLENDDLWDVDDSGYNFRHTLDVSADAAFAIAGRRYLVEFELTPPAGQVIRLRFRINVI